MSLLPSPLAAALAGTGLACFAIGATRRPDPGLKLTGLAVLAFALAPVPAYADQFVEAADNATIDCELARGELTRIALIDDGFANVSKIASGFPYNDFQVTHEPVRGDIYISVPPQFAAARVSFFATSKAGYVYKFACRLGGEEATQLFITNPALAKAAATEWETETGPEDAAIRLIEAMASDAVLPGFTARAELSAPRRTGGISWSPNTRAMNLPDSASSCATSARKALRLAPSAKVPQARSLLPMAAMHSLPVKRPVPS